MIGRTRELFVPNSAPARYWGVNARRVLGGLAQTFDAVSPTTILNKGGTGRAHIPLVEGLGWTIA